MAKKPTRTTPATASPGRRPQAPSGRASRALVETHERTVTLPWHQPACDTCGDPILTVNGAWVCWMNDGGERNHSPRVVHQHLERAGCYPPEHNKDHHLSHFRRSPARAVLIALSGVAYKPKSKDDWGRWLMVVLGLPMFDAIEAFVNGTAPVILPDSVVHDRYRVVDVTATPSRP